MHTHIMLDLETLDTATSAVVVSIGAVAFDPMAKYGTLGERFYVELTDDLAFQQEAGRTISADTVKWWIGQSREAQQLFAAEDPTLVRRDTTTALIEFSAFIDRNGGRDAAIWGNGADFDNAILGSLYQSAGMVRPWSYSRNRCYRTLKNMDVGPRRPASHEGVHHHALDDAVTQATHLQEIFACLAR